MLINGRDGSTRHLYRKLRLIEPLSVVRMCKVKEYTVLGLLEPLFDRCGSINRSRLYCKQARRNKVGKRQAQDPHHMAGLASSACVKVVFLLMHHDKCVCPFSLGMEQTNRHTNRQTQRMHSTEHRQSESKTVFSPLVHDVQRQKLDYLQSGAQNLTLL